MGNPLLISLRLPASVSVCGSGEWGFQKVLVNHRTLSFRVTAKFSSLKGFRLHRISKGHLSGFFLLRCLNDWRSKLLPVLYFSLPPQPTQLALFQPFYSTDRRVETVVIHGTQTWDFVCFCCFHLQHHIKNVAWCECWGGTLNTALNTEASVLFTSLSLLVTK